MDFANEVAAGVGVTAMCFLLLSGFIIIRQRRRRRRSIHWLSVLMLSGLVGVAAGMGLNIAGTDPIEITSDVGGSVDLNRNPGRFN